MILLFLLLFGFLNGWFPSVQKSSPVTPDSVSGRPIFTLKTDPQQLERLINDQLKESGDDKISFQVAIDQKVVLSGNYKLLFTGIPFSMTFEPSVSNGDILLKEAEVKLSGLDLPDEEVLQFFKNSSNLPEWVVIQPDRRQITIDPSKIAVMDGMVMRADTIDLGNDTIIFSIYEESESESGQ